MEETVPVCRFCLFRNRPFGRRIAERRVIDHEQIQAPIVIVVEQGNPGPHCLNQVLLRSVRIEVLEPHSACRGSIGKFWRNGECRGLPGRFSLLRGESRRVQRHKQEQQANKERHNCHANRRQNFSDTFFRRRSHSFAQRAHETDFAWCTMSHVSPPNAASPEIASRLSE